MYWFHSLYKEAPETKNTRPPFAVDGAETDFTDTDVSMFQIPEELRNPEHWKPVYEAWIQDCSGAFVKSPTIEQCLANTELIADSNAPMVTPEKGQWVYQWVPTKIKVDSPKFQMYWAPSFKIPSTPKQEKISIEDSTIHEVEVQLHPGTTRTYNGDWIQEITDVPLSMADAPPLRLDVDIDSQREKMRRRVRDARLRAKLAKYRAERMARRYEERFGTYPDEDEEEAQTEVETDATE